jgi:diguanylate cyclase
VHAGTRFSPPPFPDEAAPFVRELLLEISRRFPAVLGSPPRFAPDGLGNARGCLDGSLTLLHWIEAIPKTLEDRVEGLEGHFSSALEGVREIDLKLHRAVRRVRERVEEDLTFARSVREVLEELGSALEDRPEQAAASQRLGQVLARIRAKEQLDCSEALSLSSHFEPVQADVEGLRAEIAELEKQARRLHDQSLRDGLTGLWNRRAFQGRLDEELARANRYHSPLSLVVWDVDDFKAINDAHGHSMGDLILQSLAGRMLGHLRQSDFIARCGGEEFAVILPNSTLAQASQVAEKIRAVASASPMTGRLGPVFVTLSAGAAPAHSGDTAETLFDRAAQALCPAKSGGSTRIGVGPA